MTQTKSWSDISKNDAAGSSKDLSPHRHIKKQAESTFSELWKIGRDLQQPRKCQRCGERRQFKNGWATLWLLTYPAPPSTSAKWWSSTGMTASPVWGPGPWFWRMQSSELSVWAAIKKHDRRGGSNNRTLRLIVLGAERARPGLHHGRVLMRALFLACKWHLLAVSPHGGDRGSFGLFLFLWGPWSQHEGSLPMTTCKPNYFSKK